MSEQFIEIPKWNDDANPFPAWADTYAAGRKVRPHIICQCGEHVNIGNHHIHADGRITASYLHSYPDHPERQGCGWHVYLKMIQLAWENYYRKKNIVKLKIKNLEHPIKLGIEALQWRKNNLEPMRYDYDLRASDWVLDIGGFEGEFASQIYDHYGCNIIVFEPTEAIDKLDVTGKKIQVVKAAAWTGNGKINMGGEHFWSSMKERYNHRECDAVDIKEWVRQHRDIALCKINIEGAEYELLNYMLDNHLLRNIRNLQVQFHIVDGEDSEGIYNRLAERLSATHKLTWRTPFVWESWEIKELPNFSDRFRRDVYSQNGEDGIIEECMNRIGNIHKACCEFGANDGITFSNTYKLLIDGWTGVMIEPGDHFFEKAKNNLSGLKVWVKHDAVTPENINSLVPHTLDVLSIDIDGEDYKVWDAYAGDAKLVVVEVNSGYSPGALIAGNHGSSYSLMLQLGLDKGYFLITHIGNMIFVQNKYKHLFPELTADPEREPEKYFDYGWIKGEK